MGATKHTCTDDGRALPFGRKAPAGECPRCDELRAGAPARADYAAGRRQRPITPAERERDRRDHRRTCPVCRTGNGVCTAYDW